MELDISARNNILSELTNRLASNDMIVNIGEVARQVAIKFLIHVE